MQKMAVHKKRCLKFIVFLLPMVLAGVYCGTSLPVWTTQAKAQREDLTWASAAETKMLRNLHTFLTEQTQKLQLLLEEVAQLGAEISSLKKERQEMNQAALELASEVYVGRSDWALKSSGATIDMQRTSKTYDCKENWVCRVLWFFRAPNPPDTILQPDVSPENCWPLQGHQGQVVIRLPARVPSDCCQCAAHLQRSLSIWDRHQRAPRHHCVRSGCRQRRGNSPWDVHVQRGKRGHSNLPSKGRTQSLFTHQTYCEEQLGKQSLHLHLSSGRFMGRWQNQKASTEIRGEKNINKKEEEGRRDKCFVRSEWCRRSVSKVQCAGRSIGGGQECPLTWLQGSLQAGDVGRPTILGAARGL
ncbi:SUN domain-containing protein 2-like isoform X2 [Strigops habroptila]|nr:SUN domain-containing protein 2-like isoform X2 [Strigops habroptila]